MATTTNKQRILNQFFSLLKKQYDPPEQDPRPVLEQFIFGLCHENATPEQADQAYKNLRASFFDWNEVRVSSPRELEEAMSNLPDAGVRAERLIAFLQEVFETTYSFDLESLHKKKGVKEAAQKLARFQAANDYVISWVMQQSLGGHAIPLDSNTLRTVRRLGLVDHEQEDLDTVRTSLEHLVPKAKGSHFTEMVSLLANDYCWENEPNCAGCPLSSDCPSGQDSLAAEPAGRSGRAKPR